MALDSHVYLYSPHKLLRSLPQSLHLNHGCHVTVHMAPIIKMHFYWTLTELSLRRKSPQTMLLL